MKPSRESPISKIDTPGLGKSSNSQSSRTGRQKSAEAEIRVDPDDRKRASRRCQSTMSNTISILNDLIETLKDGQRGFTESARDIRNAELKATLSGLATQREQFAAQLQVLARSFGEESPANTGSLSGSLHRGWINLKAALASQDEHAILAECERGEDVAVAAYRKALEGNELPVAAAEIVRTQFAGIQAAHNQVKALRDAAVAH